ncbi:MAG: aminotransferase class V-fold PLP-dependent enzyme [Bdellovibrionota bacterium]
MYFFFDDYSEGAHLQILEAFSRTNFQQERGYGMDSFTQEAERLIKEKIKKPKAAVHFVSSGTHANLVCISSLLKSYESVVAVDSGHANIHEAGAVEATGHKINVVPAVAGKMTPQAILEIVTTHTDEHMVKPKAVYISQSTEVGTVYLKSELQKLHEVCQQNELYLFIDGARIGHAVMSKNADFDLFDIANYCDLFSIGGTKNGALIGEAIVIVNPGLQENFRYHLRQRGALLAKARAVTVQFVELFKGNLYFENAKYANDMAQKLAVGIQECGYQFLSEPVVNQIFPIFPNGVIEKLQKNHGFYVWSKSSTPDHSVVRLVTSWATQDVAIEAFLADLKKFS